MSKAFDYDEHVARNGGYIAPETQARIRQTRLLIAGCGIGSSPAVCAARMGFENFVLVDGDVVDAHNLNRQFYDFTDVGRPKVEALAEKILRINPTARIETVEDYLGEDNTDGIVGRADIVFDTVDFLDLPAILRLHTCARQRRVPVFTALSVGFGALVWYFPADTAVSLADIIAPDVASVSTNGGAAPAYADVFEVFVRRIAPYLDAQVVEQIGRVLALMKDGKPCPAPQVAVGSFAIGAMAMSMMHDMLAGHDVPAAPQLVVHSFKAHRSTFVDLSSSVCPTKP
jgi:molybdopterin/thiamine biosynthesis adenylyltransferase